MRTMLPRSFAWLIVCSALLAASPVLAGKPFPVPAAKKVHGNRKLEPGSNLIRVGSARAAIAAAVAERLAAEGVTKARKLRAEDVVIDKDTSTWRACVREKRTGANLRFLGGTIDLKERTTDETRPLAHDAYEARMKGQSVGKVSDKQVKRLAEKTGKPEDELRDWLLGQRRARRDKNRVGITRDAVLK